MPPDEELVILAVTERTSSDISFLAELPVSVEAAMRKMMDSVGRRVINLTSEQLFMLKVSDVQHLFSS